MNIVIVGHGPSLVGRGAGKTIDSSDLVVRLKGSSGVLGTEDYGKRCDVLCMSTEVTGLAYQIKPEIYWLYPKKGFYDVSQIGTFVGDIGRPVLIPLELSKEWNKKFLSIGGKHPNVSTGLAAVFIAGYYLRPSQINLAGFDTLLDPTVPFTRNDQIPRTGVGVIDHDWETENKLLYAIAGEYNFSIGKI
jgi:hypothetical protein